MKPISSTQCLSCPTGNSLFFLAGVRASRGRSRSRPSTSSSILSPDLRPDGQAGGRHEQERRRRLLALRPASAVRAIRRKNENDQHATLLHCAGETLKLSIDGYLV
jgi:hypothetical protein